MAKLSPIESEFTTDDEAAAHDRWFRTKVEAALNSVREKIPHDQAMARIRTLIGRRRAPSRLER